MMLSRVAENLFWLGRYMERAENVTRLVDVARRMSALPKEIGRPLSNEWASVLIAAGAHEHFGDAIDRVETNAAVDRLIFDRDNPSSVVSCVRAARENARAVRFAMSRDCWEALNTTWSDIRTSTPNDVRGSGLSNLIDWVIGQIAQFRGALHGTMVRDDTFEFIRLGMAIERVDSTARLLDVKYHVLLPSSGDVGSNADHYQWLSLLQAAAAHRAYVAMRADDVTANGVAEFLILEKLYPRAIAYNVQAIKEAVTNLEGYYGSETICREHIFGFAEDLETTSIDAIIAYGLHEFLTEVIERNYGVANRLSQAYGFVPVVGEDSTESAGQ